METLTTSTNDESRERVLVAGRIRAQRSRERRKARKALERANLEDGIIEAAIVRSLLTVTGLPDAEMTARKAMVGSILQAALSDCVDLGIVDAKAKIRARTLFLSGQPDTTSASPPPDTPVTASVRSNFPADRIADPEQNEERA